MADLPVPFREGQACTSCWGLYVFARALLPLRCRTTPVATTPLPPLPALLSHTWPCLADIFCADSSSVHSQFRVPVVSKSSAEQINQWAATRRALRDRTGP